MPSTRERSLWCAVGCWYFVAAASTLCFHHTGSEVAAVWPANAVLLTALLRLRAVRHNAILAVGFVAGLLADLVFVGPIAPALLHSTCNVLEVWIAARLMRRVLGHEDMRLTTTGVFRFLAIAGLAAPMISAVPDALFAYLLLSRPFWQDLVSWDTRHGLGLLLFTPFCLAIVGGEFKATINRMSVAARLEAVLSLLVTAILTAAIFYYHWLVLPCVLFAPTMLVTFRVGQLGTTTAVCMIGAIGAAFTACDRGPIAGMTVDVSERALIFQAFLATLLVTCLPAAADLAARSSRTAHLNRLATRRARYIEAITKCSPDAIISYDTDARIQSWNPAAERLFGYAERDVTGKRMAMLLPEESRALQETSIFGRVAAGEVLSNIRTERLHRDGRCIPLSISAAPLLDAHGSCFGVSAVYHDLSRQAEVETELASSQSNLRKLFATVDLGCFMACDLDGNINHWSAGCERLYGWSAAEALGLRSHELLRTVYPSTRAAVDTALRNTGQWTGELHHTTKSGTVVTVLTRLVRREEADQDGAVLEVAVDVTELRKAQAALVKSEAELQATFHQAAVGIAHLSLDGVWLKVNDRFCSIVDRSASELIGTSYKDITFHSDLAADDQPRRELIEGVKASCTFTKRYLQPDGVAVPVHLSLSLIRDASGQPLYYLSIVQDISERLAAEEALRQGEARLAQAAKMEALGRLAGGIAHDFNNVLSAVGNSVDVVRLRTPAGCEVVAKFLDIASQAVERGAAVTGRLLSFSRRSELSAEQISVKEIFTELENVLRPGLGARVNLEFDASGELPSILADRNQLETVVINLCNNSKDALPNGGTIELAARDRVVPDGRPECPDLHPGRYVELLVKDNGCGMSPSTLARVSEPFFTTKTEGKGTGLGLAMARGFSEQSGGALSVTSTLNEGTSVSVWLPAVTEQSQVGTERPISAPAQQPAAKVSVLLVDDQTAVRSALAACLEARGVDVIEAEDAAQALKLLDSGVLPHAVMSDLTMPGSLDGMDLIAAIRERLPRLPAMIITGHATQDISKKIKDAEGAGPFAILRKPVSGATLVDKLRAMLASKQERTRDRQGALDFNFVDA